MGNIFIVHRLLQAAILTVLSMRVAFPQISMDWKIPIMRELPHRKKYNDPNRSSYNSTYGTRDIPVFRFSKSFLIRADYGRKGNFSAAVSDINKVRERAAFKVGDVRNEVIARLYPGSESLTVSERQYPYTVDEGTYGKIKVMSLTGTERQKNQNWKIILHRLLLLYNVLYIL